MLGIGALGFVLGLRYGIDWDHIAAITHITGSVVTTDEAEYGRANGTADAAVTGASRRSVAMLSAPRARLRQESREGFVLATMYALGHASLVVVVGVVTAVFSIIIGAYLVTGQEARLPSLEGLVNYVLGKPSVDLSAQ